MKNEQNAGRQNLERWRLLADHLPCKRLTQIADVGANPLDVPAYRPLLDAKLCHVFGFEPQAEAFEKLQRQKSSCETYFPLALGSGGKETLNVYTSSGLSSVFELDDRTVDLLGRSRRAATRLEAVQMDTARLDDVEGISEIDLLKIDTQGAEVSIMANGTQKLSQVVAVITELRFFPMYRDEPSLDAQIALLRELGLHFHKILFTKSAMIQNTRADRLRKRRLRSQLLDGDCVFIRDLRAPDAISDTQASHLAIIADAVLQSYDVTLRCLDILVNRGALKDKTVDDYFGQLPDDVTRD